MYSVDDLMASTGQSRINIYAAIKRGHLKTFLVGRRRFATVPNALKWVALLEKESDAGKPVVYQGPGANGPRSIPKAASRDAGRDAYHTRRKAAKEAWK